MWAISCATTSAITSSSAWVAVAGSTRSRASRNVTQTEVLHRAGGEVGQRDEVELVARVGDAEVVGEEARGKDPALLGEAGERPLAGLMHDPHRDAVDVDRLGELELADDEGDQVGRHGHRVGEPDAPATVAGSLVGDLLGVGERGQLAVDHERDREDRLQIGLVPARERAASARRLELRDRDDLVVAGFVLERRSVEAAQLVVEHTAEADVQHRGTGLRSAVEREGDPLVRRVERDRRAVAAAVGVDQPRLIDLEVDRVDNDVSRGVGNVDLDRGLAGERRCREVGRQRELVPARDDSARQAIIVLVGHGGQRIRAPGTRCLGRWLGSVGASAPRCSPLRRGWHRERARRRPHER